MISVAYYLNLLGSFGVSLTAWDDDLHARLLTSAVFLLILFVGWTRGFKALERMEQVSVGIKLAIIAALLVGLASFFFRQAVDGALLASAPTITGWSGVTIAFGLIVTVQGFETSRYLGATYDASTRRRSMVLAQLVATAIYLIYIGLLAYALPPGSADLDETSIIDMMMVVAPILPVLLVAAALSAQFSAAVTDTSGSGGLIEELTGGRLRAKGAYAMLVGAGLLLTWTADIFLIIASRAFAVYYALQAAIAAAASARVGSRPLRTAGYAALAVLGMLIAIFGASVE